MTGTSHPCHPKVQREGLGSRRVGIRASWIWSCLPRTLFPFPFIWIDRSCRYFPSIIFLLIIWEMRMCTGSHLLPSAPRSTAQRLWLLPSKKRKKTTPSPLCCLYIYWSVVKLPVLSPLKYTESFPTPIRPGTISREELHFSSSFTAFKSPHQWLPV